jgi:hypothetical protein
MILKKNSEKMEEKIGDFCSAFYAALDKTKSS